MTTLEPTDRPRPVRDAASGVAKVVASVGGLITAGVSFGLLTAVQGDAITGLLGLIPGVVAAALPVWSAFRTATEAEPMVTPVSAPATRTYDGRLVPLVPDIVP